MCKIVHEVWCIGTNNQKKTWKITNDFFLVDCEEYSEKKAIEV